MSINVEFSKKVAYRIYDAAGVIQNMAPQCNLVVTSDGKIKLGLNVWGFDKVVSVRAPECDCCKSDTTIRLVNGDRAVIYDEGGVVLVALNKIMQEAVIFKTRVNSSGIVYSNGRFIQESDTPIAISDYGLFVGPTVFNIGDIGRIERTDKKGLRQSLFRARETATITMNNGDKIYLVTEDKKVFNCLVKKIKGGDK